jgi:hypothetical protein
MFGPPRLFTIAASALHAKLFADLDTAAASMPLPKLLLSPKQQAALLPQDQGQQQRPGRASASASQPLPTISRDGLPAAAPRGRSPLSTPRGQPPPRRQQRRQGQGQSQAPSAPLRSAMLDPERRLHSLRRPWAARALQAVYQPLRRLRLSPAASAHKVFEADASQRSACRSVRSDRSACGGSRRAGASGSAPSGGAGGGPPGAEDLPAGRLLLAEEVDVAELLLLRGSRRGASDGGSRQCSWRHVPCAPQPGLRLEDTQRGAGLAAELLAARPQGRGLPAASASTWQGEGAAPDGSCHSTASWLNLSAHAGPSERLVLDPHGSGHVQQQRMELSSSLAAFAAAALERSEHGAQAVPALLLLRADGAESERCVARHGEICCADEGELPLAPGCEGEASSEGAETCGVCMDECVQVQVSGCRHRLCLGCCRELVRLHHLKPVSCPFCRTCIGGFELAM